jgi:two-component system sensor histidine kinase KdpD
MPDDARTNPDLLLAAIQKEEARQRRGRLKVFLGMCPGVGKTFAMLEAARVELAGGRDVVIGYVETHGRKETDALASSIPRVPRRTVDYRGLTLTEMDLDALLTRKPQLALVDELAHTNVPGSRHPKRWQDVQELLDAGIDVFTTLNVQHVESRADTVRQITRVEIRETVPDSVLDDAVLELVDLPPAELMQRLHDGKVYVSDRAAAARDNFFREANLTALRELALRLVADHVGEDTTILRRSESSTGPWKSGNLLLVAVGPSPLSEPLIRWTRRMADELRCRWLAVHVERSQPLSEAAQVQLSRNLETARELGAEAVTTTDEDIARGLLRVARDRNVTQMIIGKPAGSGLWQHFRGGRLLQRLLEESGDIDLHVVKAEKAALNGGKLRGWQSISLESLNQYALAVAVVGATGLINFGLMALAGPRVPGLVFLLAVVVLALFVGRGPVLLAGALSAFAWNFFFLPPTYTFVIARAEDGILFGTYFVVALVLGQLVARIRAQGEAERRREERSTALYELTRELAEASSREEVVWQLVGQVTRVFHARAAVNLPTGDKLAPHPDSTLVLNEKELGVSDWAFRQRKAAGRFTDNLPGAGALHLPIATEHKTFGILAVEMPGQSLSPAQRDLLETFARQAALVLDRVELRSAAEQTLLLAESERLGKTLLDSISHEIRTPLAAITSAVNALSNTPETSLQRLMLGEIQTAADRLNRVVGNLLNATRVESGRVKPKLEWHDPADLVSVVIKSLENELAGRKVSVSISPGLPLVRMDFSLMEQVMTNLLLNAATHTPPGTEIMVTAAQRDQTVELAVSDLGRGIPEKSLGRIFEKFYRVPGTPAGGSGLGLSIVKGFVEAQGGSVHAANRPEGGASFTVRLPIESQPEVPAEG